MKLNSAVLMLFLLMSVTFGTTQLTQKASAEEGVLISPMMGLYWDKQCTNQVTSIDFGTIAEGESKAVTFWLKNRSTDKGLISWSSRNFHPSSNGIAQTWERRVRNSVYIDNWNKKMKAGDLWEVQYTIQAVQDIQTGMHDWDLIVSFTTSHVQASQSMSCLLTVTQ